jgi:hypothetical protein
MAHLLLNPIFLGLAAYTAADKIEDLVRDLPLDLDFNRHHVLEKFDHDFNDVCGELCVKFVAEKIKAEVKVDVVNENVESPAFESSDECRHGCTIAVRLGLSTKKEWKVATAFHKGPCKVNKGACNGCNII